MALVVTGLLLVLAAAGCAGRLSAAESTSSIVQARPTTPPAAYAVQMNGAVRNLSDALDQLTALLANPRYLDEAWKSEAVNLSTLVELGYRQLERLSPPDESQAQHAAAVKAVQDCQTLTAYVFQGINNLAKGPFDEVKQRVDFCHNKLDLAMGAPGSTEQQSQPASIEAARQEVHARLKRDANLRGGPGTTNPVVATGRLSDTVTVVGRTPTGDWLQVTNAKGKNAWIAAFLVEADGDLKSIPILNQANP